MIIAIDTLHPIKLFIMYLSFCLRYLNKKRSLIKHRTNMSQRTTLYNMLWVPSPLFFLLLFLLIFFGVSQRQMKYSFLLKNENSEMSEHKQRFKKYIKMCTFYSFFILFSFSSIRKHNFPKITIISVHVFQYWTLRALVLVTYQSYLKEPSLQVQR